MEQQNFRQVIVKQIEEEHERKNRKSPFEYQNIARHNPITNPIEYHIDNPYILKEIQNRNIYKNQSMYQLNRYWKTINKLWYQFYILLFLPFYLFIENILIEKQKN